MIKKVFIILLSVILLAGCSPKEVESDKISIVTTLFPQYDFARQIAGDKAQVTLLLPPGAETHSFEPSPSDMIKIKECDLFIYTSKYMEPWAEKLILEGGADGAAVIGAANGINHEKHGGDIDAHVWTDPLNALKMSENVRLILCTIDPENADFYTKNYDLYAEKLQNLHEKFRNLTENSPIKRMVFGTKFAFHYFEKRYSLSHIAAFDTCGHGGEPSPKIMGEIIEEIKKENIPAVFYGELESVKVAETIAREAGVKKLQLHSCHNLTKDEFQNGETYISLMEKNFEALKEGLYND